MHVLAISPGAGPDPVRWRRVLASGIDALMIREKQLETRDLLDLVRWVQQAAPDLPLWVNGRLDVALAAGCGLHTPESYPEVPPGLVPLSKPLHDPAQFRERLGCTQLLVSPVFPVPGKGPAWGTDRLHACLDALPPSPCRILALGGIDPENAGALRHPRLSGVAVIRTLWDAAEPARVVDRLRKAWKE